MSARDTSGSAPQHSHPHNKTMSRNDKFWVDQLTPPPPPGKQQGVGNDKGGGGVRCLGSVWTTTPGPSLATTEAKPAGRVRACAWAGAWVGGGWGGVGVGLRSVLFLTYIPQTDHQTAAPVTKHGDNVRADPLPHSTGSPSQ